MSGWKDPEGAQITNIPVWAFHGENDNVVSVQGTRDMMLAIENAGIEVVYLHSQLGDIGLTELELDSLLRAGLDHIYTEYIGADHGGLVAPTYDDPLLHRWLFSHTKAESSTAVAESQERHTSKTFSLYQNYPNPFNPATSIRYEITKASSVVLQVYDVLGREVRVLVNGVKPAGLHEVKWDGLNEAGLPVASGLYLYRIENQNQVFMKKMVMMR